LTACAGPAATYGVSVQVVNVAERRVVLWG
jgi:hypothetical protein